MAALGPRSFPRLLVGGHATGGRYQAWPGQAVQSRRTASYWCRPMSCSPGACHTSSAFCCFLLCWNTLSDERCRRPQSGTAVGAAWFVKPSIRAELASLFAWLCCRAGAQQPDGRLLHPWDSQPVWPCAGTCQLHTSWQASTEQHEPTDSGTGARGGG